MSIIDILTQTEDSSLVSLIHNTLGKTPSSGDDLVNAARYLRKKGVDDSIKVFELASHLEGADYYDEYNYKIMQYEKLACNLSTDHRIRMLESLLDYSCELEYSVELSCLYLSSGKTSQARRIIINAQTLLEPSQEFALLWEDIRNDTKHYQMMLQNIDLKRSKIAPFFDKSIEKTFERKSTSILGRANSESEKKKNLTDAHKEEYPEIITETFKGLVGMKPVKDQLVKLYNRLIIEKARVEQGGTYSTNNGYNFILYGNPGTGKTTVARVIANVLYKSGVLKKNTVIETDRSGLVGQYIGDTEKKTKEVLAEAMGGVLFIDEAYGLFVENMDRDFGIIAIDTLLKDMEDNRGKYCVILAGYKDKMKNMIRKANAGFSSRFDYHIELPDYSNEDLYKIVVTMANSQNLTIEQAAKNIIFEQIDRERIDETFDNARFMRRLLNSAIEMQATRLMEMGHVEKSKLFQLTSKDFEFIHGMCTSKSLDDYLYELDQLIGLEPVKKEVRRMVERVQINQERKKRGISTDKDIISYHMAFTGNPGTGKTTVARLLGKILTKLGVLKREDVFVECSRADLVGEYQGQTATKTKDVIYSALGGVLFIDEAYNLKNGSNDSFGIEAINTLISEIENNRDCLTLIIAGYTKEIADFMDSNPGLKSRIPIIIEFPDYSIEELAQIFVYEMKRRGYDTSLISNSNILKLIEQEYKKKDFGNARGVRNICEIVENNLNSRLAKLLKSSNVEDAEMLRLIPDDLCLK